MKTLKELAVQYSIKEVVLYDRLRALFREGKKDIAEKRDKMWFIRKKGERELTSNDWLEKGKRLYNDKIRKGAIHSLRGEGRETNLHFNIRLSLACKVHRLLLKDISEATGIPTYIFQSIDQDKRTFITKEELARISEFFNTEEDWFLETSTIIDFTKLIFTV